MNTAILNGRFSMNGAAESTAGAAAHGTSSVLQPELPPEERPQGAAAAGKPSERESDGRFAEGNLGGPGNPHARQVALMRKVFLKQATPERMAKIADQLLTMAEQGNVPAAKLVLSYILGKPQNEVRPDRVDHDEMDGYVKSADFMPQATGLMTRPGTELPLELVRNVQPAMAASLAPRLAEMLYAEPTELNDVLKAMRISPTVGMKYQEELGQRAAERMSRQQTGSQSGQQTAGGGKGTAGEGRPQTGKSGG